MPTKTKNTKKVAKWEREVKADDVFLEDPKGSDRVIALMGPTGAGKSTFINILMGKPVASVGDDLESHTTHVAHFTYTDPKFPDDRIVVIDTPGFDDTYIDDREILRRIAVWLARSYHADMKLAGVIYLHKITHNRMAGSTKKYLSLFEKLCGKEAAKKVVLTTTMWSEITNEVGEKRENQLKDMFWKEMLGLGSSTMRFGDTQASAQHIVNYILAKNILDPLEIQREMVDVNKRLQETEAARTLASTLQSLLEKQKRTAAALRQTGGGPELQEAVLETDAKIRATLAQLEGLSIRFSFSRRFMRFFRFSV